MPRLLTSTALLALIAVPHMAQAASWGKQYLKDAACRINRKTLPNGNFEIYASPFAGKSVDPNSRNRARNLLGQGPVTFSVNPNGPYDRNGVLIVKSRDNRCEIHWYKQLNNGKGPLLFEVFCETSAQDANLGGLNCVVEKWNL